MTAPILTLDIVFIIGDFGHAVLLDLVSSEIAWQKC